MTGKFVHANSPTTHFLTKRKEYEVVSDMGGLFTIRDDGVVLLFAPNQNVIISMVPIGR